MHYVMSDIHGDMDKFLKMLRLIRFHRWDKLYILGDVVDRGNDGVEILKYIMQHKNIILLKGNHERDMCDAVLHDSMEITEAVLDSFELWFSNGGEVTYRALLEEGEEGAFKILMYVNDSPSLLTVSVLGRKYLLVHAGIWWNYDFEAKWNLEMNEKTGMIYDVRNGFLDRTFELPFTVVAGHTPVDCLQEHMPDLTAEEIARCNWHQMILRKDKILIDCGCGNGHNLGCLRLEGLKEFYVD